MQSAFYDFIFRAAYWRLFCDGKIGWRNSAIARKNKLMEIGEMIHTYRIRHGMTMLQFAEQVGVSKGYVSMLEHGKNPRTNRPLKIGLDTYERIMAVLRTDTGMFSGKRMLEPWKFGTPEYDSVSALLDAPDFRFAMRKIFQNATPEEIDVAKEQVKLLIKAIFLPEKAKRGEKTP